MQLHPETPSSDVGVIIGRFQVSRLTDGHRDLINSVLARHPKVVIFLGSTPGLTGTRRDPLDFMSRMRMIHAEFSNIMVLGIKDEPTNEGWSKTLDSRIKEHFEVESICLYGSRDSFAPAYSGQFPVISLQESRHVSGTAARAAVSNMVLDDPGFRDGVIYSSFSRRSTSFQTVDIAVIQKAQDDKGDLLILGRKTKDPKGEWRFPGGFIDPLDESLERAAMRELGEEMPGLATSQPKYVGSFRVDDWRYRNQSDKILTALFVVELQFGNLDAGDDLDKLGAAHLSNMKEKHFVAAHRPLFTELLAYLKKEQN